MTTIGSIKIQVTKAVKALRASMEEAEKLQTGQVPSNAPAVKSASVSRNSPGFASSANVKFAFASAIALLFQTQTTVVLRVAELKHFSHFNDNSLDGDSSEDFSSTTEVNEEADGAHEEMTIDADRFSSLLYHTLLFDTAVRLNSGQKIFEGFKASRKSVSQCSPECGLCTRHMLRDYEEPSP
ncbi:unnamed protein product [Heligmosomoides polygyrus]|uniref:BTB/POZ domain-containing protein n=1 Tax=Heligmosomoides polygyrus TaxID=6339 RepID=A0A3P8CZ29_HELPZ|nr:unnamed protein product [Heligmosomoides polygyrus]